MSSTQVLYDPWSPQFQHELWDVYRAMRDHQPVYRAPDDTFFALTRFADVSAAAADHETYSSRVAEANDLLPQLIFLDPPRQAALRKLVSAVFTPRRVAAMEDPVRNTVRALLGTIDSGDGCEFQHEYAAVIPSVVVAGMIGLDDDYVAPMRACTETFLDTSSTEEPLNAAIQIYTMFAELLEERRRRPQDDMMSALISAEIDGERLSDEELLGFCLLLVLGGNDTTASLIGSGIVLLLDHPDQLRPLQADPALWPAAIEEMLRLESPTQALPRNTTRDVEMHGVHIPAGSRVMLVWGSANHDEREFPDPERFDVFRKAKRHLAFGHGVHYCMGTHLARLEARIAFTEWFARFPDCRLAGDPQRVTSSWARAFNAIPLHLR